MHFEGNHKRVKTLSTLIASVYHFLLKKQIEFATMSCYKEDSNWKKALSNKTPTLLKIMNMDICVVGISNQLFIRGS